MRDDTKAKREDQVADAAYALIEEKGYAGASMLAIARKARASNETLYNWYGDKHGLFRRLIIKNTEDVRHLLDSAVTTDTSPLETLSELGPVLLTMLLGERAIALNRAAAADPTGVLGQTLAQSGREKIAPCIGDLLEDAKARGDLVYQNTGDVVNTYVALLVGDLQIRRATGAMGVPSKAETAKRAVDAVAKLQRLYGR